MSLSDKDIEQLDDVIAEDNELKVKVFGSRPPQPSRKELERMGRWFAEIKKAKHSLSDEDLKAIK